MNRKHTDMETLDLTGGNGPVFRIANEDSLAWGAAKQFREAGAELAISYLNDRAKPHVAPLARQLQAPPLLPCDVAITGEVLDADAGYHIEGMVLH